MVRALEVAQLSDLPNEIIILILTPVSPDYIESFSWYKNPVKASPFDAETVHRGSPWFTAIILNLPSAETPRLRALTR